MSILLEYTLKNNIVNLSSVCINNDRIFIGTTNSGIFCLDLVCISGTDNISTDDLSNCLYRYKEYPNILSDNIRYLHCNGNYLSVITDLGIDVFKLGVQEYRSSTTFSGIDYAEKCFITSLGTLYYTLSGVGGWAVSRVNNTNCDWVNPDYSYNAGGVIFSDNIITTDIFVTEKSSGDGLNNTLFVATSSGGFLIDEGLEQITIFY